MRTHDRLPRTLVLAALALGAAAVRPATAQDARPRADTTATRSSRSGVYTAAQAGRGEEVYAGFCRSCHTAASHTGVTFANWWKGRTVAELYGYISTQMPKNDPGGLDAAQYADVVAYLLRMNAMPTGRAELPPDPAVLGTIRIDVTAPAAKSGTPVRGTPVRGAPARGTPVRKNPR